VFRVVSAQLFLGKVRVQLDLVHGWNRICLAGGNGPVDQELLPGVLADWGIGCAAFSVHLIFHHRSEVTSTATLTLDAPADAEQQIARARERMTGDVIGSPPGRGM
jgi:hypothetical protein